MREISKKDLVELARQLSTPIDFEQMEREGILEKKGAWYKVNDLKSLPEHISRQAREIMIDNHGNCLIKLPKSWTKAQKLYNKMVKE